MKKGITIVLLMVAMVALAVSASAVAPTITNLPSVIISDAGDTAGSGTDTTRLLRYENVIDLAGAVTRTNNPSTTTFMSVFYTVAGSTLKASNSAAKVEPMTGPELTALLGGTAPAAKKINAPSTNTWLSLINGAVGTYTSAKTATVATNGTTSAALAAAGALIPRVITLYATDYFQATDKVGSGTMIVYSILEAEADAFSPATTTIYDSGNLGAAGHDGWIYNNNSGQFTGPNANLCSVPSTVTANGTGFAGLATWPSGKTQGFSSIAHTGNGTILADVTDMAGFIYCMKVTLTGNAADALLCPSYRLLFLSTGFAHMGGLQVTTKGGAIDTQSAPNMPVAGTGVEARLYWGVPTTMNQYADGQKAATVAGAEDKRDYYATFDVMQAEAGDVGTLIMERVIIQKMVRPAGPGAAIAWGPGARAFNEVATAWSATLNDGGTGWGTGISAVSATEINTRMQNTKKSVFSQINPIVTEAVPYPAWESGKLIRVAYNLAASNTSTCPQIRMFVIPWVTPLGTFEMGNLMWGEALDPSVWRNWYAFSLGLGLAGSPKVAGSALETYIYTMNAPVDVAEACILAPILDIDQNNAINFPVNGWARPNATVAVKACSMTVLN